jgi:hypothetical protein
MATCRIRDRGVRAEMTAESREEEKKRINAKLFLCVSLDEGVGERSYFSSMRRSTCVWAIYTDSNGGREVDHWGVMRPK